MTPFVSSIGPSAHSSDSNAVNSLKIPIQETTRAMVSVSPYQLSDYGFREAFDTYQAQLPAVYSIIGILVALRIAYLTFRMEGTNSYFKLFQNVLSCYFWLWFFPDFFKFMLHCVALLQDSVLRVGLAPGIEDHAVSRIHGMGWSAVAAGVGLNFLGPVGWFLSLCLTCVLFLPTLIALFYGKAFLLGLGVLVMLAPIVIVGSTLLEVGMALKLFNFTLLSLMLWPFLWSAFGRVGLLLIGNAETGLIEAALVTFILGLLQGLSPIILMYFMRGVNPGEVIGNYMGKMLRGAASLPVATLASPLLGLASGIEELRAGAKLAKVGSFGGSSGISIGPKVEQKQNSSVTNPKSGQFLRLNPKGIGSHTQGAEPDYSQWKTLNSHQFFQAGAKATGSAIENKTRESIVALGTRAKTLFKAGSERKKAKKEAEANWENALNSQMKNLNRPALPAPEKGYLPPSDRIYEGSTPILLRSGSQSLVPNSIPRKINLSLGGRSESFSENARKAEFLNSLSKKFDLKPIPRFGAMNNEMKQIGKNQEGSLSLGQMQSSFIGIYSRKTQKLKGMIVAERSFAQPGTQMSSPNPFEVKPGGTQNEPRRKERLYYYNPNKMKPGQIMANRWESSRYSVDIYRGPILGSGSESSDGLWIDISSRIQNQPRVSFIPNQNLEGPLQILETMKGGAQKPEMRFDDV